MWLESGNQLSTSLQISATGQDAVLVEIIPDSFLWIPVTYDEE